MNIDNNYFSCESQGKSYPVLQHIHGTGTAKW